VHGLRHRPEGDTCGWYIWRGELTDDPEFFNASHVAHLRDNVPQYFRTSRCLPAGGSSLRRVTWTCGSTGTFWTGERRLGERPHT
jgi:hypothetical protein